MDEPVELPITDTLDLHSFQPSEVREVAEEYLLAAQRAGLRQVRLIHGRGMEFSATSSGRCWPPLISSKHFMTPIPAAAVGARPSLSLLQPLAERAA